MEQLTFNQRVAAEIRAELGRQNLSQACLASELGWVQSQLSRRLRGIVAFSTDEIEGIARQLDVPIEQLVREPSAERGAMRLLEEARKLPGPVSTPGNRKEVSDGTPSLRRAGGPRHLAIRPVRDAIRTGTDS